MTVYPVLSGMLPRGVLPTLHHHVLMAAESDGISDGISDGLPHQVCRPRYAHVASHASRRRRAALCGRGCVLASECL